MTDQLNIYFPDDMPFELEVWFNENRDKIKANLWDGETRKSIALEWSGTRLCCPLAIYYDLPDTVKVTIKSDSLRMDQNE